MKIKIYSTPMKIKIYSTPTCHLCDQAKNYFKEHKIKYSEANVATDIKAREEMIKKSGQRGVPVIEIGENILVGFDEEKVSEALRNE